MANRFTESFSNNSYQQQDFLSQFNSFRQNPYEMLAQRGINIPNEYRGNYQQAAQYLMNNMPANQQNGILQKANMLKQLLGIR